MKAGMQSARGFTLIELVIVSVIMGIMATALVPLATSSLRAYRETVDDVAVLDKLRYATERLAREIRGVQYASDTDPDNQTYCSDGSTNRYCVIEMTATRLQFRMCPVFNFTTIPTSCAAYRIVTIENAGSTATLSYSDVNGGAPQVLTDELGSLTLTYYQNDGVTPATLAGNVNCKEATTPACVGYIEINLTLSHNSNPYTQRTRIGLRTPPV